jgi:glycerol-3-phosphate dehydrogenase
MAKDAIDEAARGPRRRPAPSTTEDIPMVGAVGYPAMWNRRKALAAESGLHVERIEKMLMRHGVLTTEILELVAADPSLGGPLPGGEDYLRAEIVYAASHEGALHLDDILARRTRLSIESFDRALTASTAGRRARRPRCSGGISRAVDGRGAQLPGNGSPPSGHEPDDAR